MNVLNGDTPSHNIPHTLSCWKWGEHNTREVQEWFDAPYDVVIAVEVAYAVGRGLFIADAERLLMVAAPALGLGATF